jgi:hypothetical protein
MEFKNASQQGVHDKTRDFLQTLFGEVAVKSIGDSFVLQEGSTFVYVRVLPVGETKTVVEVFSYVVVGVTLTAELLKFLLVHNLKLILGAFGVSVEPDGKGIIILSHSILGNSMDREELYGSVSAIARVADEIDEQIVAMFGGSTALDKLMSKERPPVEIWE